MTKYVSLLMLVLLIAVGGAGLANAQAATMPTLYDQSGHAANTGGGTLGAGWYYLNSTGTGVQVYYYGNGTYYDPSTNTYGGSIYNPKGTAGAELNYAASTAVVPGVPNTGMGGQAALTWITLAIAGIVALGGLGYVMRTRTVSL